MAAFDMIDEKLVLVEEVVNLKKGIEEFYQLHKDMMTLQRSKIDALERNGRQMRDSIDELRFEIHQLISSKIEDSERHDPIAAMDYPNRK